MKPVDIAREAILTHNALQKGPELASFLALLEDLQPKVIVEIGADAGGTLWAWQQLSSNPRVIGIDMPSGPFGGDKNVVKNFHGCEIIYADSHEPETFHELDRLLDGAPIDMLFIDGDHTFKGVSQDFAMYWPLVRPGGIVALHDICDHPDWPAVKVKAFWDTVEWNGRKEAIITPPSIWGGIGVLRVPETAEVAA